MIGKYHLVRTIGEGTFAKIKLAINTINGEKVAIKIIDKHMIKQNNLIYQVSQVNSLLLSLFSGISYRLKELFNRLKEKYGQ